jgi:hypothetical protein
LPSGQDAWFQWIGKLSLEEPGDVINVVPVVLPDPKGGFLIADRREGQIRSYAEDGSLRWAFGRRGPGPEEFEGPSIALRLRTGEIFVADEPWRMLLLDSTGTRVTRTFRTKIQRVEDVAVVSDSLIVISGLLPQPPNAQAQAVANHLHIFDIRRDTVLRSFFSPLQDVDANLAVVAGSVVFSVRDRMIVAAALPKDSLYFLDLEGRIQAQIKLPTRHFRVIQPLSPSEFRDPRARARWLSSFETVTGVHWVTDDLVLVQYRRMEDTTPHWSVLGVRPTGQQALEWADAPKLFAVIAESGVLIFQDPNSMTPDRWLLGRLK